jgi:hypothetical protein
MRWRAWGEPEPEESPLGDFFIGLYLGAVGFPMSFGWVFVSVGWMEGRTLLALGAIMGILLGARFAWGTWRRKRKQQKGVL